MYDIAFLTRSKQRIEILQILDKPKTATNLAKQLKKSRSSISRTLISLKKKSFVKCLNSEDVLNRYYQITEKGRNTLEKIKEIES